MWFYSCWKTNWIALAVCLVMALSPGRSYAPTIPLAPINPGAPVGPVIGVLEVMYTSPVTDGSLVTVGGSVTNTSSVSQAVTLKGTVTFEDPSGGRVTLTGCCWSFTMAPGQTIQRSFSFVVQPFMPRGTYTLEVTETDTTGSSKASFTLTIV